MHAGLVEFLLGHVNRISGLRSRPRRARRRGAGAAGARLLRARAGVRLDARRVRGADRRTGAALPRDARARRGDVGAVSPTANGDVVAGEAAGRRVRPGRAGRVAPPPAPRDAARRAPRRRPRSTVSPRRASSGWASPVAPTTRSSPPSTGTSPTPRHRLRSAGRSRPRPLPRPRPLSPPPTPTDERAALASAPLPRPRLPLPPPTTPRRCAALRHVIDRARAGGRAVGPDREQRRAALRGRRTHGGERADRRDRAA